VLTPAEIEAISGAQPSEIAYAVAPLSLPSGRLGAIVAAGSAPGYVFPDLTLQMLAGLADQANVALSAVL
jgi:hypothetical protein